MKFYVFRQLLKKMFEENVFFGLLMLSANGVFGEVKTVSVMEGDSVTLHTDLTELQTDDQILWRFGSGGIRIAEINKWINIYHDDDVYVDDGRFRDRLMLNSQTGSLTITNIRITDSGLYKLQIISDRGISYKRFNVNVYADLPVPVISRDYSQCSSSSERSSSSTCVLLCSVMDVTHVTLSWYKGNSLFSSISASDLNIRLSLPLEVEYQDTNTYSCVVENSISSQTQYLYITDVCQPCSELQQFIPLTAFVVTLVVLMVGIQIAIVIYYFYKKLKTKKAQSTQLQTHSENRENTEETSVDAIWSRNTFDTLQTNSDS